MKSLLLTILLFFGLNICFGQTGQDKINSNAQMAIAFYSSKDYEKAAPLLLDVYNMTKLEHYFRLYLSCLLELKQYDEALEQIQKEIKKQKNSAANFFIHWGYILKTQKRPDEAEEKYKLALENIPANKGSYVSVANDFLQWREYEWAQKTYLLGRSVIPQEQFSYELARVYLYLRNYEEMMEEYLNLIRQDEKQIPRVESSLASAMSLDVDDKLRDRFRSLIMKRIQAEPQIIGYNRLLIWFFLQEKKFPSALRQAVALDRRTGKEDVQIFQLAQTALFNKNYSDARDAYEYLLQKGENNPFYKQSYAQNIHSSYMEFVNQNANNQMEGIKLANQFDDGLKYLGYLPSNLNLIQEYAHLLAFYLNESDTAIEVLNKGLAIPRLKAEQTGQLKTELADIYVYENDPWEATLLYSQVIDANKDNSLGDEVKLKKARLGYYVGNFDWAKAQLDVLKASTSKLTANDALDLSMLISNNLNLDTTAIPLKMFAHADLLFFRNKDSLALATLDSIAEMYPYNSLVDDILYRKSKIEIERQNYELAAKYLEQIRSDFSYDLLADDALFLLAEIYENNLNQQEKAKEYYKEMLTDHPGSVFIDESRAKYRELREIYPDNKNEELDREELFLRDTVIPNEPKP